LLPSFCTPPDTASGKDFQGQSKKFPLLQVKRNVPIWDCGRRGDSAERYPAGILGHPPLRGLFWDTGDRFPEIISAHGSRGFSTVPF